jgi:cytoskeletal protein RodZ
MSTVAEQLRLSRESQQLTLAHVGEITKIRTDHLRALEEGNFDVFPAAVYIRGFVRTYATLLKLDVPQVMAALEKELIQNKRFADSAAGMQPPKGILDFVMLQLSKLDWKKSLIMLGTLLAVGVLGSIYFVWRHYQSVDPLKDLKPALYQSTQTLSGETLPLPAPRR